MKNKKILFAVIRLSLVCALLLSLASCKGNEDSVKIESLPDRCVYYIGEKIDVSGASLCVSKNGKTETVNVTKEMLGSDMDRVFTSEGKADITLKYDGAEVKIEIFVDGDLERHKSHALSSFSSWAEENTVSDGVSENIIKRAKDEILSANDHASVVIALENAKKTALDYTNVINAANALIAAKEEALQKINSFDLSVFAKDHAEKITTYASDSRALIENAATPEEVKTHYDSFISKADELKNDSSNAYAFKLEKGFKEKYEAISAYYDQDEYARLTEALIKAERDIRECQTDDEADAIIKNFFEHTAKGFNTIPDIIYKKLSLININYMEYGVDIIELDEIADKILSFLSQSDSVAQLLENKTGRAGVYELASMEGSESLSYYSALANYKVENSSVDLILKAEALYLAYEKLEQANEAAKSVIKAIDAIGKVRLDSEAKIAEARKAYEDWSKKYSIEYDGINGSMISNYSVLENAEETMEDLPEKAEKAAKKVREEIKALLAKSIIYSDTDQGVGQAIAAAYRSYNSWIETYGNFADIYVNDGTNYKLKLDSYNNEYQQIVNMANEILAKIKELRALMSDMSYDNYESCSSQVDTAYKSLTTLYTSFKNTNGHITDKISEYELIEDEILYAKFKVHYDRYCKLIETEFNGYFEKISTDLSFREQRESIKKAYEDAKSKFSSLFSYEKSLDANISALEDEYEKQSEKLKELFNEYCYDYEKFSANERLVELSKSYSDISFVQTRDTIIEKAQKEISELSQSVSLQSYKEALSKIVENAEKDLKNAFSS